MTIKKLILSLLVIASAVFSVNIPAFSQEDSGINSGNHGLHLRGSLGAGQVLWAYILHGSESGDLGTGAGVTLNLAAMYNYSLFGIEGNLLTGSISELEWTDDGDTYKSTGTGSYTILDFKLGLKLFAEQGDMGYTFIYAGKRYWSTERNEESVSMNGTKVPSADSKREAKGDGWIFGFRDFSTFGENDGSAIILQTGAFFGKAPVSEMKTDGDVQNYPVKESVTLGGEIGAGLAFQNIGLTIVGGVRGEINATSFNDSAATGEDESVFGFGNRMVFVEVGLMF